MQSFAEFIVESSFSRNDFDKHTYSADVIADIIANGKIKLGSDFQQAKDIEVDDAVREQFKSISNSGQKITVEQFNEIAAKNKHPFAWNRIFKGTYSGHEQISNIGEYSEAGVAYCFNVMNGDTQILEAEDDAAYDVLKSKHIPEEWIMSSKRSAEKLHDSISNAKDCIAAHVDGKDISKIPSNAADVAKVFCSKRGIREVLKQKVEQEALDSLYAADKDTWNKADIVVVRKDFDIQKSTDGMKFANSTMFNAYLNSLIENKTIWPVSLKKVKPNAKLESIKFELNKKLEDVDINEVKIVLPNSVIPTEKYIGSCYLKADGKYQIDFRHATAQRESLSIELKLKMSKGGKGMQQLKDAMKLESGFYKKYYFETEEDFLSSVEALTGVKLQPKDSLRKSDPKWFIRPAFKGLVGLLTKYQQNVQQDNNKVNLVKFFTMVYNCCSGANSESNFWKLSM